MLTLFISYKISSLNVYAHTYSGVQTSEITFQQMSILHYFLQQSNIVQYTIQYQHTNLIISWHEHKCVVLAINAESLFVLSSWHINFSLITWLCSSQFSIFFNKLWSWSQSFGPHCKRVTKRFILTQHTEIINTIKKSLSIWQLKRTMKHLRNTSHFHHFIFSSISIWCLKR